MCFTYNHETQEENKSWPLDNLSKIMNINVKLNLTTEPDGNFSWETVLGTVETDIIMNLPVRLTKSNDIIMQSVITQLSLRGYSMDNAKIWFYSKLYEDYVDCGLESSFRCCPIMESEAQDGFFHLKIQVENTNPKIIGKSLSSTLSSLFVDPELLLTERKDDEDNLMRVKDRTVEEVMLRVATWRKFYIGRITPEGKRMKCTLEEAAKIVRVPKKTLDDHLQQIRKAAEEDFDFDGNRDKAVGTMRRYVKRRKCRGTGWRKCRGFCEVSNCRT
eukprot:TRINITY_DN11126_c0_g1_i3.p1 TRINITY_DN11126_c0_g1~~TRINITY_DN11126_c0_g1_i3.p1  ORF type:complete len:274 (+),score=33.37 TRINITY_DN11126_c0_g1_i3:174-995(+)